MKSFIILLKTKNICKFSSKCFDRRMSFFVALALVYAFFKILLERRIDA